MVTERVRHGEASGRQRDVHLRPRHRLRGSHFQRRGVPVVVATKDEPREPDPGISPDLGRPNGNRRGRKRGSSVRGLVDHQSGPGVFHTDPNGGARHSTVLQVQQC